MTLMRSLLKNGKSLGLFLTMTTLAALPAWAQNPQPPVRVIEILADHDSRYKIAGQKQPEIIVKAGERITLRITAKKAKNMNRDGSIHGFSLLHAKDRKPVSEWDFLLKPGVQEFTLTTPNEPGEYVVVCTVICSQDHEGMSMKFVVLPEAGAGTGPGISEKGDGHEEE
jgi:heme/copper-type cytochrome/quinol oxidase subunit 2